MTLDKPRAVTLALAVAYRVGCADLKDVKGDDIVRRMSSPSTVLEPNAFFSSKQICERSRKVKSNNTKMLKKHTKNRDLIHIIPHTNHIFIITKPPCPNTTAAAKNDLHQYIPFRV